jgi:hypothetical protein
LWAQASTVLSHYIHDDQTPGDFDIRTLRRHDYGAQIVILNLDVIYKRRPVAAARRCGVAITSNLLQAAADCIQSFALRCNCHKALSLQCFPTPMKFGLTLLTDPA